MRLAYQHLRAETLELLRYPSFSVPTLLFPTMFFLFFVAPHSHRRPNLFMASYAAFALLGVAFFQFGVGIAAERASPWQVFLRALPAAPAARFAARVAAALEFGLAAAAAVVATALLTTSAGLDARRWLALVAVLLAGSVPFALLGIAIGYWATPKGALPLANVLYLGLSYAGGLWTGAGDLPRIVREVSPYLPTRRWGDLLAAAVAGPGIPVAALLWLLAYSAAFAVLATWGYRRDEGQRFR